MADEQETSGKIKSKSSMDMATVLGLSGGFGLVVAAILMGGAANSFINIPSFLIVIGGTFGVTAICFSPSDLGRSFQVIRKTVFYGISDPSEAANQLLQFSEMARRQGTLSLEHTLLQIQNEPFLHKGILMVSDGTSGEEVEAIMQRDLYSTQQRHIKSAAVLRRAAEFAPAMGLIGTLIGLVQMLGRLDDPATIGPSMAVALLTTFYGAVLSNMVFSPLASKLERNSAEEALLSQVYILGAASIARQENPRRLEMLLNSVLPPAKRVKYFD
jgi:chemotaxis protein MotA